VRFRSGYVDRSVSKREAEKYLFGNDKDFAVVCESAGMDAGRLRAELPRFRECAADSIEEQRPAFAKQGSQLVG
jgi:hypothetical protein